MPLYDDKAQANPSEDIDPRLEELRGTVLRTVTVLEENKKNVRAWLLKGLLAFNLLIGSIAFWVSVLPFLLELLRATANISC